MGTQVGLRIIGQKNGVHVMLEGAEATMRVIREAATAFHTGVKRKLPEEEPTRGGGYLCIVPRLTPSATPLLVSVVGTVPEDKMNRYFTLAVEKAKRLHSNPGHFTSRQSRDPGRDQWAGAIVAGDYILSFSGLPEDADEVLVLLLAIRLGLIKFSGEFMSNVLFMSGSHRYDDLFPRLTSPPAWAVIGTSDTGG